MKVGDLVRTRKQRDLFVVTKVSPSGIVYAKRLRDGRPDWFTPGYLEEHNDG